MQPFLRAVCPILIVPEIGREFVDPVIGATWDPLKWYRMIPAAVCFFGNGQRAVRCLASHEFQSSVRCPQAEFT